MKKWKEALKRAMAVCVFVVVLIVLWGRADVLHVRARAPWSDRVCKDK